MRRDNPNQSTYQKTYIQFSNQVEMWIRFTLLALVCLLIAAQLLLHVPQLRPFLTTVDKLEGEPIERG